MPEPPVEDERGVETPALDPPALVSSRREALRWRFEQVESELALRLRRR
jgi:hypothetical protein